ncbi:MAG: hypothetical protein JW816_04030 [Candidatus Buchananbacteria bacterium]|nr:hypothetical protein [Candidatus Buchananbacteria bacterium]
MRIHLPGLWAVLDGILTGDVVGPRLVDRTVKGQIASISRWPGLELCVKPEAFLFEADSSQSLIVPFLHSEVDTFGWLLTIIRPQFGFMLDVAPEIMRGPINVAGSKTLDEQWSKPDSPFSLLRMQVDWERIDQDSWAYLSELAKNYGALPVLTILAQWPDCIACSTPVNRELALFSNITGPDVKNKPLVLCHQVDNNSALRERSSRGTLSLLLGG